MRATVIFLLLMGMLLQDAVAQQEHQPKKDADGKVIVPPLPASSRYIHCNIGPPPKEEPIYEFVEEPPTIKSSECYTISDYNQRRNCTYEAWQSTVVEEIGYPKGCGNVCVEGTIYVRMIIDKEGRMTNITIVKDMTKSKLFSEHTLRKLNELAKDFHWNPGLQRGKPVKVRMIFPVKYSL